MLSIHHAASTLVAFAAASPQNAPLPKEWSQPHGNAASTAFVDVAPLKSPPTERWRIKGQLLAGPVVSQAKLFEVVREEGKVELVVVEPATGASVAKTALDNVGDVLALAVGDGLAAVFEPTAVHGWRLVGTTLKHEKTIPGSFGGEPTLDGTTLLAPRGKGAGGVQWIDWAGGKTALLVPKSFGRASLVNDEKLGASLVVVAADDAQKKLTLQRFPITTSPPPVKVGAAEAGYSGPLLARESDAPQTVLVAVKGKDGGEWCAWFGGEHASGILHKSGHQSAEFKLPPASAAGRLYGFDHDDRLVEMNDVSGETTALVEKEGLRKGARIGAPSIARDVLFLGNWAVELGSKHVLWCLDSIDPDGPAVPAGDELLVIKTKSGELVGFGNGPAGATTSAKTTASEPAAAPTVLPGSKPGLVRADGLFLAGKATALDDGRWRLEPEGGAAQELDEDAVALVDDGRDAKRVGEELAIYRAFWRVLAPRHADSLVPVFEKWREAKLFDECRRVLDEAKQDGLAGARVDELMSTIAGKTPVKLAATSPVRKKVADLETDARSKTCADVVAAAKWCAAHDAKLAASVLVARATERSPRKPPEADLATSWTPESFPGSDLTTKSWLVWADALLPSGATFVTLDPAMRHRLASTPFGEKSLALRSRNILLLSKETDPAVLGPLLARGEATVRALQKILGPSPAGMQSAAPLEVRLHVTRTDYLADHMAGGTPMVWSAGVFSPYEGVSRFYSKVGGDEADPLNHTLHEVFSHELTHHYVDRRWMRSQPSVSNGGYWMVEGFAEFIAEQAVEIGRLGEKFDDATVRSLDATSAAEREEQLLPLDTLFEIDHKLFDKVLEGGRFGPVQLRHTLQPISLDKRGVFYAEAAAFSFFVMNRCGEKCRPTYVEWLKRVYSGKPLEEPWKDLGFADMNALKRAFRDFLKNV